MSGDEKLNRVVERISQTANELQSSDIAKVLRWVGKMNLSDEALLSTMEAVATSRYQKMTAEQLSWVLWGFCRVDHGLEDSLFDGLAAQLAENVEVQLFCGDIV